MASNVSISPNDVSIDGSVAYIDDAAHNVVRRTNLLTGELSNPVGTGDPGYSGDGTWATEALLDDNQAIAADGDYVYIADTANNVVRQYSSDSNKIRAFAGSGTAGYGGDGGAAGSAELDEPHGVAVDSSGDVYIADSGNNVVREVNTSGVISTIAGNGTAGYSGDGGAATQAELDFPTRLAWADGGLYIADTGNNVVRMVSNGTISTVAGDGIFGYSGDGGPATSAELSLPSGLAVGSTGNLFIADTSNNRVREVAGSVITTVAGTGTPGVSGNGGPATAAELDGPSGVSLDANDNLYIADTQNDAVRVVSSSTGDISNLAGNGFLSYSGDGGPSIDAELNVPAGLAVDSAGNVYFADTADNVVRKINVSTGDISTVAGTGTAGYGGDGGPAGTAQLNQPDGIALDQEGDLYIADSGNNVIREVSTATGDISTVAGDGTAGYSGDGGAATSAELNHPIGVSVDPTGDLIIADTDNNVVREVDNGVISTIAGGPGSGAATAVSQEENRIVIDSGTMYIADGLHNVVRSVDLSSGVETVLAGTGAAGYSGDGGSASQAKLNDPTGLAVDGSGDLFIADSGNNVVREVSAATETISTVAGTGTAGYLGDGGPANTAELDQPAGLGVDASGNLYIADSGNNVIRELSTATGDISTVAGDGTAGYSGDGGAATSAELNNPQAVALTSSMLFVADTNNDVIREVNLSTGNISTFAGNGTPGFSGDGGSPTAAQINHPSDVGVDNVGDLYIADQGNDVIREVLASSGTITTVAGDGMGGYSGDGGLATSAELQEPGAVAVSSGEIFIGDQGNNRVRLVSLSGTISTVAGNGFDSYSGDGGSALASELNQPDDVDVNSSDNVFVSDTGNEVVREFTISGVIDTVAGNGTLGNSGNGGAATSASLDDPSGISLGDGGLFIADAGNNVIRFVNFDTGVIVTYAGNGRAGLSGNEGPATSAEFDLPTGVAYDQNGNLWISDSGNARVRFVSGGGGL